MSVDLDRARDLLRYMTAPECREYRSILRVFVDRPLAEFTPEDISLETGLVSTTAQSRMKSLREWGNLTELSSIRSPSSLEEYYRRSKTYLITPSGQDTFAAVEEMIGKFDQVDELQTGRLRTLRTHLTLLIDQVERDEDPSDTVQAVFDTHLQFANQLRTFSAELNVWQRRYDLDAEQVSHLAGALVEYFAQRLREIDLETPRIGRSLERLHPLLPDVIPHLKDSGLAAQLDQSGLGQELIVRRRKGTRTADWDDMHSWFVSSRGMSEIDRITDHALAAVRTLTSNLTRLSRGGSASASHRSDFLRLAGFFHESSTPEEAHDIAGAVFSLGSCRHLGYPSADMDDPAPINTDWKEAPQADVPLSLRERGDTAQRGGITPIRDRKRERQHMKDRREASRLAAREVASELIASVGNGRVDGCTFRTEPFRMLLRMISNATPSGSYTADGIRCDILRDASARTVIKTTDGRLVVRGRVVTLTHPDRT